MALLYRNTDQDWQQIGREDPFWGVLTAPEFRKNALTAEKLEVFYSSGVGHVEWLASEVAQHFQHPLKASQALDFGCGVGRLTQAMTRFADKVIGVDISPDMLAKAREHTDASIRFQSGLTDERFDWLHSFIVFQHIPPARGMTILKDLLARLLPGGLVTLHFTIGRSAHQRGRTLLARSLQWIEERLRPKNRISMFDYDLGRLTNMFYSSGVRQITLLPTDHGGHLGVLVIGRRDLEG